MLKTILAFGVLAAQLAAHDIITTNLTFTRDISRIFARHCAGCHGATAAIPLTTYEEARPWAVAIKEQVLSRAMPPWGAVKGFGNLKPDHALTQEEILIVAAWVIGGAPQGNPDWLPKQAHGKAAVPPPSVKDAITGGNNLTLAGPMTVEGIRPLAESVIESARITAHLPNGAVLPLVWLYRYDPKSRRDFLFREPLQLPKGAVIEATAPIRFVLETLN
jgi:mono/diheme cytochrome c family protein